MADEPTYTLAEAARELKRLECGMHGHDLDIVLTAGGRPSAVICSHCGESWPVGDKTPHRSRVDSAD